MAAKRTRKEQIDAGKRELPKKLSFLQEQKVDYLSITHDEASGELTVELGAAAVKALARKASELKELKAGQKELAKQAALVPELLKDREQLIELRAASDAADEVMRKALRRIKALEKQLGLTEGAKPVKKTAAKPESTPETGAADGTTSA